MRFGGQVTDFARSTRRLVAHGRAASLVATVSRKKQFQHACGHGMCGCCFAYPRWASTS
jgi:hypothetical protein